MWSALNSNSYIGSLKADLENVPVNVVSAIV